jgi:hypothetical protein
MAVVKTDVSEERSTSIIRETRIGELGTSAITSNRRTLRSFAEPHGATSQRTTIFKY